MGRGLGAPAGGIDRLADAAHDVVVDAVLDVRGGVRASGEAGFVGLVAGEQQLARALADQVPGAQVGVLADDRSGAPPGGALLQPRPRPVRRLPPGVAEPEVGQHPQLGRLRAPVDHADPDQHLFRRRFGVLDEDVEVAVPVEDPGVEQLVLHLLAAAGAVHTDQVGVGEGILRVLVQHLQVGAGRGGVEVEVVLLHVLAVIALRVGQPEEPLLEDRVTPVPQREREAEPHPIVAEAGDAVLAPAVGPRAGVVVGKAVPGIAVRAVVLPDGAPLALAEIRSPFPPGDAVLSRLAEALLLLGRLWLMHVGLSCLRLPLRRRRPGLRRRCPA